WGATVGLLRAAGDAGRNALYRAEARGRELGRKEAQQTLERRTGDGYLQVELDRLRKMIREFEEASGLKLDHWNAGQLGREVRIVQAELARPGWSVEFLGTAARRVASQAEDVLNRAR